MWLPSTLFNQYCLCPQPPPQLIKTFWLTKRTNFIHYRSEQLMILPGWKMLQCSINSSEHDSTGGHYGFPSFHLCSFQSLLFTLYKMLCKMPSAAFQYLENTICLALQLRFFGKLEAKNTHTHSKLSLEQHKQYAFSIYVLLFLKCVDALLINKIQLISLFHSFNFC